jgi:hypothetical protein
MVSLMDWAEAKIVDLGCVYVMMMAKFGWTTQIFCFVLCLRAELYLPDTNTGGASNVVLPFLCCPWKLC